VGRVSHLVKPEAFCALAAVPAGLAVQWAGRWARSANVNDFMPHGYCFLWNPLILWLHVISDSLIVASYYCIPVALVYLVYKRRDLPFTWIFWMFGLFIMGCGTTHPMEVWTIWHPAYLLAGVIKAITAAVSVATAIVLIPLIPKAISLPSQARLLDLNRTLEEELAAHRNFSPPETHIKRRITVGGIVAALLMGLMGLSSWLTTRKAATEADWVAHTNAVMTQLETLAKDLIDLEGGARGFSLSGQEFLLAPYKTATASLAGDVQALQALTRDNPGQQRRLDLVQSQAGAVLQVSNELIATRRHSHAPPEVARLREASKLVDDVRSSIQQMQAEENQLLIERSEKTQQSRRQTTLVVGLSTFTGLGLLLVAWFSIRHQIELARLARAQVNRVNVDLEQRVAQRTVALESEISQHNQAEEALRENQQRLAGIIDSAMDAIITIDEHQVIVMFNAAAERMFGCPSVEATGSPIERFIPERFRKSHPSHIRRFAETGTTNRSMGTLGSIWGARTNGEEFPLEASISQVESGGKKLFTVILRDITERARSEERLLEQARIMEQAQVVVRDMDSRVVFWPLAAQRLYGFTKEETLGNVSHDLFQTQFPEPLETIARKLFESGSWEGELIHRKRDGGILVVASVWVLHCNHEGKPTRILETNTDITARKQAEARLAAQAEQLSRQTDDLIHTQDELREQSREIRKLNEELEQRVMWRTADLEAANKELEAFTYSVSHDLRAPLRHISGFTKILTEEFGPSLPDEAQKYLQRVEQGAHRMGQLVDELLNLTRVGRQALSVQVTGLNGVVKEVLATLEPEIEGREVEWKIGELPFVECDPTLVRLVFQNLISNALKYTRPRSPAVIAIGQMQKDGQMAVFVRDNGVGFSMKYADKLFGVFQRLHRGEDFEGTGVGLATVHRIVQKHGGRVWAEAELDKGATFYFTLKGAKAAVTPPAMDALGARA
jgi:PAS domain S-box-containing protein